MTRKPEMCGTCGGVGGYHADGDGYSRPCPNITKPADPTGPMSDNAIDRQFDRCLRAAGCGLPTKLLRHTVRSTVRALLAEMGERVARDILTGAPLPHQIVGPVCCTNGCHHEDADTVRRLMGVK